MRQTETQSSALSGVPISSAGDAHAQAPSQDGGGDRSTARRGRLSLPLLASPGELAAVSASLGLYFMVLYHLTGVMLGVAVLGIVPIVSNIQADNFSNEFKLLMTHKNETLFPQFKGEPPVDMGMCRHTNEANITWIQRVSVGHHCSLSNYSNPFDCPSVCSWDAGTTKDPRCQGLDPIWLERHLGPDPCSAHMPCNPKEFGEDTPRSIAAECWCCELELAQEKTSDIPTLHYWVWAFVATLLLMVGAHTMRQAMPRFYLQAIEHHETLAEYSVALWSKALDVVSDEEIAQFGSSYGDVVQVTRVLNVGEALKLAKQLTDLNVKVAEVDALVQGCRPFAEHKKGHGCCGWLRTLLYKRFLCLHRSPKDALRQLRSEEIDLKKQLHDAEAASSVHAPNALSHMAIITFDEMFQGRQVRNDQKERRRVLGMFLPFLQPTSGPQLITCQGGGQKGASGDPGRHQGRGAPAAQAAPGRAKQAQQKLPFHVAYAPEAGDIMWESAVPVKVPGFVRRGLVWLAFGLLMSVLGYIQFELVKANREKAEARVYCERGIFDQDPECRTEKAKEMDELTYDVGMSVLARTLSSIYQALFVNLGNLIIHTAVHKLTPMELYHTQSQLLSSMTIKLVALQLVNSFVLPVAAVLSIDLGDRFWFVPGGMIDDAFYTQLILIATPNAIALLHLPDSALKLLFAPLARTEGQYQALTEPPEFLLPLRAAHVVLTILLGVLYAPILPVSPLLALANLLVSTLVDRILLLRVCRRLPPLSLPAFRYAVVLLQTLPLGVLVVMIGVYFQPAKFPLKDLRKIVVPVVCGAVVWVVLMCLPVRCFNIASNQLSKRLLSRKRTFNGTMRTGQSCMAVFTPEVQEAALARLGTAQQYEWGDDDDADNERRLYNPAFPEVSGAEWKREVGDLFRIRGVVAAHVPHDSLTSRA